MLIGPNFIGDLIRFFIKADIDDLASRGARFSYSNRAPKCNSYVSECFGPLTYRRCLTVGIPERTLVPTYRRAAVPKPRSERLLELTIRGVR
jgi:hypothetical protein